jgi:hypothetical protein
MDQQAKETPVYDVLRSDGQTERIEGSLIVKAGGVLAFTSGGPWAVVLAPGEWKTARRV